MSHVQAVLFFALLSFTFAHGGHGPVYDPCTLAYLECDWEFYRFPGQIPIFSVNTKPDRAFTPNVVSKNPKENIGTLNSNGITAEFIRGEYAIPVTEIGHPRFTPTHFKPFAIDYVMGSGVGHQTFHGNQKRVARGQCVRVFFSSYKALAHGHPSMVDNITVRRSDYKCVVFRLY